METYNFNDQQLLAFNKYISGENVFITGPGGSGKSYFIQQVYKHAIDNHKRIQITAMTGCAAILLESAAKTVLNSLRITEPSESDLEVISWTIGTEVKV